MSEWNRNRYEAVGREWQQRLGLADWTVDWREATPAELDGDRASCMRPTPHRRCAVIRMADAELLGDGTDDFRDLETTVVHELLHLHLWEMTDALDSLKAMGGPMVEPLVEMAHRAHLQAEERAIYHIAKALVALRLAASPLP